MNRIARFFHWLFSLPVRFAAYIDAADPNVFFDRSDVVMKIVAVGIVIATLFYAADALVHMTVPAAPEGF